MYSLKMVGKLIALITASAVVFFASSSVLALLDDRRFENALISAKGENVTFVCENLQHLPNSVVALAIDLELTKSGLPRQLRLSGFRAAPVLKDFPTDYHKLTRFGFIARSNAATLTVYDQHKRVRPPLVRDVIRARNGRIRATSYIGPEVSSNQTRVAFRESSSMRIFFEQKYEASGFFRRVDFNSEHIFPQSNDLYNAVEFDLESRVLTLFTSIPAKNWARQGSVPLLKEMLNENTARDFKISAQEFRCVDHYESTSGSAQMKARQIANSTIDAYNSKIN